jgi:hypothetical protein
MTDDAKSGAFRFSETALGIAFSRVYEYDGILMANSRRESFGRKLGKMRRTGKAKPWFADARDEFANSITCYGKP